MEDYQTWRDLLAALIEKPRERSRLAKALGVSPATLQRWAAYEGAPLAQQQERLLQAVPQHAMLLRALLAEEFSDLETTGEAEAEHALLAFSTRVFAIHANASEESRYWSICSAVLAEAVARLDPERLGLALSVIQCIAPPHDAPVRALRESACLGTPPWPEQIEFRISFLGSESLAGQAVSSGSLQVIASRQPEMGQAGVLPEQARSALALPILHTDQIAGCLLAVSTQADFFNPQSIARLQSYAALLKMAFSPEQFYPLARITLQAMPSLQVQRPYLSSFQQRVLATLKTAFTGNHALNYLEAQQFVWGQIAEELLQLQASS